MNRRRTQWRNCLLIAFKIIMLVMFSTASSHADQSQEHTWAGKFPDGHTITQKDIDNKLAQHVLWIQSKYKDGNRFTCQGCILSGINLTNANLFDAYFEDATLNNAIFVGANLNRATFINSSLHKANLSNAKLNVSLFWSTKLEESTIRNTSIGMSKFLDVNLKKSDISDSIFSDARFENVDLTNVNINNSIFSYVNFNGAIYEKIEGSPKKEYLYGLTGLESLKCKDIGGFSSMIFLRNLLKEAGLREQEREITYAIQYGRLEQMHLFNQDYSINFGNLFERSALSLLFLLPCDFGLHPLRPLAILCGLIPFFAAFYYYTISHRLKQSRIYKVWAIDRLPKTVGSDTPERLHSTSTTAVLWALYFSILSASRIGWREITFGNWIANIQQCDYYLKPTGWARTLSGIQSVISVYLLALSVLTYFGRPFE